MMDPQGSAAASGQIAKGMVLVSAAGVDCKALTFDAVMNTLIAAPSPVSLVFEEAVVPVAVAEAAAAASEEFTVMASDGIGGKFTTVQVTSGTNLRTALVGGGADLYKTLWDKGMNCAGVGQCGTCIVEIEEGGAVSPRTAVEDKKLKGYGANVRLACQTNVEGQLVVKTQAK
jgi:ferredoxin